jgi:hypothetical protein
LHYPPLRAPLRERERCSAAASPAAAKRWPNFVQVARWTSFGRSLLYPATGLPSRFRFALRLVSLGFGGWGPKPNPRIGARSKPKAKVEQTLRAEPQSRVAGPRGPRGGPMGPSRPGPSLPGPSRPGPSLPEPFSNMSLTWQGGVTWVSPTCSSFSFLCRHQSCRPGMTF